MNTLYNDSIVKIIANNNDYDWYSPYKGVSDSQSIGTGFFIDASGYILTCGHVIQDSNLIEISIPSKGQEKINAKIISISPDYDLALLKVELNEDCKFLNLGDSDQISQGDIVNAVGYPLGQEKLKVSQGVISGFQAHLIQTDAPINSGNSGGPLVKYFEDKKEFLVLGINSQKISSDMADNIGYSIPINYYKLLENSLKSDKFKLVYRPRLLSKFSITNENTLKYLGYDKDLGYLIYKLSKKSCLYKVGVRVMDLLVCFDGYDIDKYGGIKLPFAAEKFNIIDLLYRYPVGKKVKIKIFNKKNGLIEKEIELEYPKFNIEFKFPNFDTKKIDFEILSGLIFCDFTLNHIVSSQIPEYLSNKSKANIIKFKDDLQRIKGKLYLVNILAGSFVYSKFDITPGIFLVSINDNKVKNLNQLRQIIRVLRNNKEEYIIMKFSNDKIIVLDFKNIIEQNKILSLNFDYETSKLFEELN